MKACRIAIWATGVWVSLAAQGVAQDAALRVEPFPQSAKLARDRRAEAVLETARAQLRQQDYPAAIVALQELLDGANAFVGGGATVPSFVEEANRLLREMPPVGRDAYERLHGASAMQLWQEARQTGRVDRLREVVARFGATRAGWNALRDLAARHADRGEWRLAAAASLSLARHPLSTTSRDTDWLARWVLAEARAAGLRSRARDLLREWRKPLEATPAPPGSGEKTLAAWLEKQVPTTSDGPTTADMRDALHLAPSGHEVARHVGGLDGDLATWWHEIVADWDRYDVLSLPSAQPLVVGNLVVSRFAHPAKIVAVDVSQGKLVWEQFLSGSLESTATDLQRHPGIRAPLIEELQRRWFGDSVRGRLSSDGRRLFLVRDLEDLDLKPGAGSRLRNHLEAWDLATGERLWRVGSSVNEPPTGFEGLYFLGPPLVSDGLLYVIAQRELQVALWVLRASDGQLDWTLPLAETDRQQFRDPGWRHVGCPVTWADGRLICSTGAGCFVAVDPTTRMLAWSLRYERDDISEAMGFVAADRERPFPFRWWESWREAVIQELSPAKGKSELSPSRRLLLAAPESRTLRVVQSNTGEVIWRVKFDEPLFLATNGTVILVFERDRVTGLDSESGRVQWQSELPSPTGMGDWLANRYVCPTAGGWSLIDGETGEVRRSEVSLLATPGARATREPRASVHTSSLSLGRLARVGSRWAWLTARQVSIVENLATRESELAERVSAMPNDAEARLELASLARQFRDWPKAEMLLRPLLNDTQSSASAAASLRTMLLRRLGDQPSEHSTFKDELLRLSPDGPSQVEARQALIEAARNRRDWPSALRYTLDMLHAGVELAETVTGPVLSGRAIEVSDRLWEVRRDRWAQGIIADALASSDAETVAALNVILEDAWQRAFDSPDAFALLSFADQLSALPMGRKLHLQLSGRSGVGVAYLPTSVRLHDITRSFDREQAAEAWYRLALLHEFRSEPIQAADCYRELKERFADLAATRSWLADVAPESAVGRALANGPRDPWPDRLPKISRNQEPHGDVYCWITPIESADPIWRRMTVWLERQAAKVRFTGAGQRGYWDLPLPKSNSPFRHDWHLHRGWGIGPLLVLQVGEELFGIQPIDERGETNAKLLWSVSTAPHEEIGAQQFVPGRVGVRLDESMLLDRYEQPVLKVVHVSPGVLCYRTRNRLVALDPVTGSPLWARRDVSPNVVVSGDAERIFLRDPATQTVEQRRIFDGRLMSRGADPVDPKTIVWEEGRLRVLLPSKSSDSPATESLLRVQDLGTGATRWERTVPARSVVLRVDTSRLGVIEPAGTLRFLSLNDGRVLAEHEVSLPPSLTVAQAWEDDLRVFVVLSGPVTEQSWLATQQDRGGFRRPLLNGWLLAFDRLTLRALWTIPARNLPVSLDQPRELPFLLLTYKRPSDDSVDGQHSDGVLHLIDKRTGKELLFDVVGINDVYVAPEPDPAEQQVDLLTPKRRVRLEYAAE